ncbi:S26 family signal peptidase [Streptomyces sp. ML-6]|uniref:S26 family signal peptidase n=1 Tax=Streptomyces sp. ML-6 TaxID=2982693 RepID=UPI0024C0CED9|nr:S26 family signal peptidase [Streptomyces sp. ML-6]MDK0518193.1 S26 family signal peptidase [Streptomyces sp. ML-6]
MGTPVGEPRTSLPAHVLAALPAGGTAEPRARPPRRPWVARTGVCAGTVAAWAGALVLLLAGAAGPALTCGLAALALTVRSVAPVCLGRRVVAVTVHGESMRPTYRDGDRVLVRRSRTPRPGQVVVIERPTAGARWSTPPVRRTAGASAIADRRWLIKRVVAVEGDPIPRDRVPGMADSATGLVPPGSLVLLGDNPVNSLDSQLVGYFPAERVLGTVWRSLPH